MTVDLRKLRRAEVLVSVVAVAMLLWAGTRHPYSYYTVLRWVTCAVAALQGWHAVKSKHVTLAAVLAGMAILFNPLAPIYLSRATWRPIDLASAMFLFVSSIALSGAVAFRQHRKIGGHWRNQNDH